MEETQVKTHDTQEEGRGWLTIIGILFMFPALFFICVFLPMWLGWTSRH